MKRTAFFVLSIITLGFIYLSCENQKTAQEYIREEKKAIDRFKNREGIKVISKYPANHKFASNGYFKTDEGLYFQVIDSGKGRKIDPFVDVKDVQVRFDFLFDIKSYVSGKKDTIIPPESILPMSFLSGPSGVYGQPDPLYNFSCAGWAIPLQYVNEGAVVNIIIPSSLGNTSDNNNFIPRFYKKIKYTNFY